MRIVVEGSNGAGKSTLINYLKDKYDLKYFHSNNQTENTLEYHQKLIEEDNVICDRFNLGEIIYPIIYARKPKMRYQDHEVLFKQMKLTNTLFIIFIDSIGDTLNQRLTSRGDTPEVLENSSIENQLFMSVDSYLEKKYPEVVLTIDIAKVKDQIKYVEDIFDSKEQVDESFKNDRKQCIDRAFKNQVKQDIDNMN